MFILGMYVFHVVISVPQVALMPVWSTRFRILHSTSLRLVIIKLKNFRIFFLTTPTAVVM